MKKKAYIIFLMCIFCCSIYGEIYTGKCGENATWSFDFDKEVLTISGVGEMYDYESRDDTPWRSYSWKIGKIVIEDGITSVGSYAFNVMSHCTSVTLGESIVSIHDYAFYYSKYFKQLTIPDKVKTIGKYAFMQCEGIETLYVGEGVNSVEKNAFLGVKNLKEVHIKSLENWLKIQFIYDELEDAAPVSNPLYYSSDLYIDGYLIRDLEIPEGIETLNKNILCNIKIESLSLPSTLKKFNVGALRNRDNLLSINVSPSNQIYDTREGCNALIETATNTIVFGCNNSSIPDNIVAIGDSAFWGCKELKYVSVPASVEHIGVNAFSGCSNIETITIPDAVSVIEKRTFYNCGNLRKVVLGKSVKQINKQAFSVCVSLDSLVCLSSIVPELNFQKANTSWEVYNYNYPFYLVKKNGVIVCPVESDYTEWMVMEENSLASYGWRLNNLKKPLDNEIWYMTTDDSTVSPNFSKWYSTTKPNISANSYRDGLGIMRFDKAITLIPTECFKNRNKLSHITLPDNISSLDREAFSGCTNLKYVNIPEEVTTIGIDCFNGCESIDSLYFPEKVNLLFEKSLEGMTNLSKLIVSKDNKTYDSRENSNAIIKTEYNALIQGTVSTVIPCTVTSIANYAFYGIANLSHIEIPNSVKSIGSYAFSGTGLKSIEIPNTETTIDEFAFYNCSKLTSILLPNTMTKLGDNAFSSCAEIVFLDLPDNLKYIPNISNCPKLKHITTGSQIAYIFNGTITNCDNLQSITITAQEEPSIYSRYNSGTSFYSRQKEGTGVLYHPTASSYPNWMSQLSKLNWTEDTIPERKVNELWYRTTDGEPLNDEIIRFSKKVVSNSYKAGYGIIRFENPVTQIDNNAFHGCEFLTSITIPSTVETIGDGAFAGCSNLNTMKVEWEIPPVISENVFEGALCKTLYVPQNTRRLYEKAPGWNKFLRIIQPYNYVEEVKIEVSDYTVRESDTLCVKATVFPDDAVIKDLEWLSSDEAVAIVKEGMIIGKKVGTVEIIAKAVDGSLMADTILVKVTPVLAEKVSLNQDNVQMLKEHTFQLVAQIFPERTTYKDVIWESSDENILRVEDGVITAKKAGVANVIVKTTDGSALTTSCRVRIEDYFPADVNWDAVFNIADVSGTINFLMEKDMEGLVFDAADMDKDGLVLVNDLKDVLDVILSIELDDVSTPYVRKGVSRVDKLPEIIVSDSQSITGTDYNLRLGLIDGQMFSAIQFDLVLPKGITLTGIKEGIDVTSHHITSKDMGNGVVRIAVYSMDNRVFMNDMADLIVIGVRLEDEKSVNIQLRHIIVATPKAQANELANAAIIINNGEVTSIAGTPVSGNEKGDKRIVNLVGVSVDEHYKGVVIKDGKKIIMK